MNIFQRFVPWTECYCGIFIFLLLQCSASNTTTGYTPRSTPCLSKLDVAFTIDSSYSVGAHNFREILKMVTDFATRMPVSRDGVHVSVVPFSDGANASFLLNEGVSFDALHDLLNDTDYIAGSTQTGLALQTLRQTVFTVDNGDRPDVPNLAIVITDGTSSNPEMLTDESQRLRNSETEIFAIGLGFLTDPAELEMLGGNFVFSMDFLDQAHNVTESVVQAVCQRFGSRQSEESTPPPKYQTLSEMSTMAMLNTSESSFTSFDANTTQAMVPSSTALYHLLVNSTQTPDSVSRPKTVFPSLQLECECSPAGPSDIVLVVDSSDTVGADHFRSIQHFMIVLLDRLNVTGKSDVRVGVIQYSDDAREAIRLRHFNSSQSLNETIMNLKFTGGGLNTAAALNVLASEVLTTPTPNVSQIALMITSGPSRQPLLSRFHAGILHHHRTVHLFTVGIGSRISRQELENIASAPTDTHVFVADDFSHLQSLESPIATALCTVLGDSCTNEYVNIFVPPTREKPTSHYDENVLETECQNLHTNCSGFTVTQCSEDPDWSRLNCALSCGLCEDTKDNSTRSECVDKISNCDSYGSYMCTDVTYYHWASDNCAGYCNFCNQSRLHNNLTFPYSNDNSVVGGNTTSGQADECVDLIEDCENYGGPEVCQKFKAWASVRCRAYCGFCPRYIVTTPTAVNGTSCPQWRIPVECSMATVEWSWCPMPSCPDGYFLTATRQE